MNQRRIGILLVIAVVMFSVILIRLWMMQVVNVDHFRDRAEGNRLREIILPATRGLITDRNGAVLVDNRATIVVSAPHGTSTSAANIEKWSKLLEKKPAEIIDSVEASVAQNPLGRRVLARDVRPAVAFKLREQQNVYPELRVSLEAVRSYPNKRLAAHLLGYIGEISGEQLKMPKYDGYEMGDRVGKAGVEASYEPLLAGVRGIDQLEVDAAGNPVRRTRHIPAVAGHSVKLTIDRRIQASAEEALAKATRLARREGMSKAKEGAAVVLDVRTGAILALASYPGYDPRLFIGGISTKKWKALNRKSSGYPLYNRAVMSVYPPGSTFKPFVALAALDRNVARPTSTFTCEGKWRASKKWRRAYKDWTPAGHGTIGLRRGLAESCDIVFYELGYRFFRKNDEAMQKFVRRFGFGAPSGVDLPFESKGRVPDRQWKKDFNKNSPEYAAWLPGDSINMAIGQGDLLLSPLQLAVGYAALANGGKVYRPYIVDEIIAADGRSIRKIEPRVQRRVPEVESYSLISQGLAEVVSDGTAKDAFRGFDVQVAGKTGTAQVTGKDDFAWFASYAPADDPRYAVVVLIEQGGHGGSVAAPAARKIYTDIFGLEDPAKEDLIPSTDASR